MGICLHIAIRQVPILDGLRVLVGLVVEIELCKGDEVVRFGSSLLYDDFLSVQARTKGPYASSLASEFGRTRTQILST